ncbi:MAG: hypothetical protein JST44_09495 [Cyanobacteria bacterium SZAS LIN-5]|jgi:hypothetical protein|nr:hypothetical protein [Cyanobacteria bacterium SZAS LIN-5]
MNYALRSRQKPWVEPVRPAFPKRKDPLFTAFRILQVIFVGLPIISGLDKFFHLTTNWDNYLAPFIPQITHIGAHETMILLAPIEIAIGLMVALKPRIGSAAAALLFLVISLNCMLTPGHLHLALLDLSLFGSAIVLCFLSWDR